MIMTSKCLGQYYVIGDSANYNHFWDIVTQLRSNLHPNTRKKLEKELEDMSYITDRINETCNGPSWYYNKDKRPCKHLLFLNVK